MSEDVRNDGLASAFAALGEPTRLAIVERLLAEGELPAGALGTVANISAPAISRHLKVLREAGVVRQRVDRQRRLYSVRPEALAGIVRWTRGHEAFWSGSLDRLAAILAVEAEENGRDADTDT